MSEREKQHTDAPAQIPPGARILPPSTPTCHQCMHRWYYWMTIAIICIDAVVRWWVLRDILLHAVR